MVLLKDIVHNNIPRLRLHEKGLSERKPVVLIRLLNIVPRRLTVGLDILSNS